METQKPITMKFQLGGGKDGVIPMGITEHLVINVRDGNASFHFQDSKTTRAFVLRTNAEGHYQARYIERAQCAILFYPNMTQKEIMEKIYKDMEELRKK